MIKSLYVLQASITQGYDKDKRPDTREHQQGNLEHGNSPYHSLSFKSAYSMTEHDLAGTFG